MEDPLVRGLATLAAACLVLFAAPASAQAQSDAESEPSMQGGGMTDDRQLDDARAREHFQIATRYYDEGRFVDAAEQFEEAYQLSGRPELQYNAYIAYREAHQRRRAAAMLQGYLEGVPGAPDRVNLEARLVELRRAIELEETQAQNLTVAEREAREQALRADDEARARREAESAPEAWPWVVMGVGAAALIGGVVVGSLALGEASALGMECDGGPMMNRCLPQVSLEERRDDARRLALVGDFLLFGGGTVAATGLVLGLLFGLGGSSEEEAPAASAMCTSAGCYGTIGGTF